MASRRRLLSKKPREKAEVSNMTLTGLERDTWGVDARFTDMLPPFVFTMVGTNRLGYLEVQRFRLAMACPDQL